MNHRIPDARPAPASSFSALCAKRMDLPVIRAIEGFWPKALGTSLLAKIVMILSKIVSSAEKLKNVVLALKDTRPV